MTQIAMLIGGESRQAADGGTFTRLNLPRNLGTYCRQDFTRATSYPSIQTLNRLERG